MVASAEGVERGAVFGTGVVAGGIVGMDEQDGARARGDGGFERGDMDGPAVVVVERVGAEAHVFERGEEVEEWIAGLGGEELVAGIAEEAEEEAVGLAGAGGEQYVAVVHGGTVRSVVAGDGGAGRGQAARVGRVTEGVGMGERSENGGIVSEAALCGVGLGQVEERARGGTGSSDGLSVGVGGVLPAGAVGEDVRHKTMVTGGGEEAISTEMHPTIVG